MGIKSKLSLINLLFIVSSLLIITCIFTACNNYDLGKDKLIHKEELQHYLESKQQDNYTVENWNMICEIIKNGQDNVNLAENISDIKYSVCEAKMSVEAISVKELNPIKNGAFFVTELSWESYVRRRAKEFNENEDWIKNVLQGGNGGKWSHLMMSKNSLWVAILDDQMTVSTNRNQTAFKISTNNGIGIGNFLNRSVKFWIDNDVLTIIESDDVWQFNYDSAYTIAEQSEKKLNSPQNIDVSIDEIHSGISIHWGYSYSYGNAGAVVEVKVAGENEFDIFKVEYPYMNVYTVELKKSNLKSGKNIIKIYHKGGPMLNATDKLVYRHVDSEPVFFEVIINDNSIEINTI